MVIFDVCFVSSRGPYMIVERRVFRKRRVPILRLVHQKLPKGGGGVEHINHTIGALYSTIGDECIFILHTGPG